MATGTPNRGTITARLDALRFEFRSEIANVRTDMANMELRLTEKFDSKFGALDQCFNALAQDFRELKGSLKSVSTMLVVLLPTVTALTIFASNLLVRWLAPGR